MSVFSAHARRSDVFSADARALSMSTQEKLVSWSEDVKRNAQSVWHDIAAVKARLEPMDTLSKAFASTLRGSCRDYMVTYIMICISGYGRLQVYRLTS